MRFAAALLIGLVAADRSYFQKRQDNPIAAIFSTLKPMVESLDQAILAYTSGSGDDVIGQSKKIVGTVKSSLATVNGQSVLDVTTASGLVVPVQDFTKTLDKTISDLISKKQVSVANGLGPKVYANLEEQLAGATALAKAIQSKMPSTLQSVAEELSGGILTVINKGITAFQDVATAGAGAGAGAGAAGSSPASGSTTSTSGSAGGAGASLSPAGSSTTVSGSGAGAGMSSSGMASSGMGSMSGSASGSASYGASGSYDASSAQTTSARGSSPAVYTGAGASFKPASVFGLVAVAAAVFVL